jgi:hypothetical protein
MLGSAGALNLYHAGLTTIRSASHLLTMYAGSVVVFVPSAPAYMFIQRSLPRAQHRVALVVPQLVVYWHPARNVRDHDSDSSRITDHCCMRKTAGSLR